MKKFYVLTVLCAALLSVNAQQTATFDDVNLDAGAWWNGSDGSGGFSSGGFYFPNSYDSDWGSWSGFSVSAMQDSITPGWENQYSAIAAGGANNSENYAVVYVAGKLTLEFENPLQLNGMFVTNATFPYLSMKNGDDFTKKFGGADGTDPDYFKLIITGTNIYGAKTETVEFMLADFTFDDSKNDYILKNWRWVDLTGLGPVRELHFSLESTDVGDWGMNTPAYFCIDNFNGLNYPKGNRIEEAGMENLDLAENGFYDGRDAAGSFSSGGFTFKNNYNEEWGSWGGFAASAVTDVETRGWENQFSAIPGKGALGTQSYAVAYVNGYSNVNFPETTVSGLYITNSTFTYWAIKEGDAFSKKFGGINGTDPDWLKVTITGVSAAGDTTGTIDYYLADFRPNNVQEDFIVDSWEWVDLSALGNISMLQFSMSSSDVGDWGMNTPAYFCIDQLNHHDVAPEVVNPVPTIGENGFFQEVFYVDLDSVFHDADSDILLKLEYIDNTDLVFGNLVKAGKPKGTEKTMLALNITPNKTGMAEITISATSNGKTVYHTFNLIVRVPVAAGYVLQNELKIYPNPVKDVFFVEVPPNVNQIVLTDLSGKVLYRQKTNSASKLKISSLTGLSDGIYILSLDFENKKMKRKIVKR